jgi:tetratricopeptide (TPR) repeat protein
MESKILFLFLAITVFSSVMYQNINAQVIPQWFKNTAKWYGEGLIPEKEFLEAIEWLLEKQILVLDPDDIKDKKDDLSQYKSFEKLVEKGVEQLKFGDNADAILYFDEALKLNPDNVKALVDKGIAHARTGDLDGAHELFIQAIKVGEAKGALDHRAVVNAGIAISIYGNQSEAIPFFDRVIENKEKVRQETLYAALVNKGVVLHEQQRYEEAITNYDQALELNPGRLGAIINKANALQELHRYTEALEWFKKAYLINPDPLSWKPTFVIITE